MPQDNRVVKEYTGPHKDLVEFLWPYYGKYKSIFDTIANNHVVVSLLTGAAVPFLYNLYNLYRTGKSLEKAEKLPFDKTLEKIYSDIGIPTDTPTFTAAKNIEFPKFFSPNSIEEAKGLLSYIDIYGDTNIKDKKILKELRKGKLNEDLAKQIFEKGMIVVPDFLKTRGVLAREASHGWIEKSDEAPIIRFVRRYLYPSRLEQSAMQFLPFILAARFSKKFGDDFGWLMSAAVSSIPLLPSVGGLLTEFFATRRAIKKHLSRSGISREEKNRQKMILSGLFKEYLVTSAIPSFVLASLILGYKFKDMVKAMGRQYESTNK